MSEKKKSERYSGDMTKQPQVIKIGPNVKITFRGSRKFDLHVGRNIIVFRGRETKIIPAEWLKTKDFAQQKHKFIVEEVTNG